MSENNEQQSAVSSDQMPLAESFDEQDMPAGLAAPGADNSGSQPRQARSAGSAAVPAAAAPASARPVRRSVPRARRMSLSLTHVSPWSVAKVTFMLMIAFAIIQIVAALLVWLLLDAVGVFTQVNNIAASAGLSADSFNMASVFSISTVLSAVTILSVIEVVVFTLLAAIGAMLYNVIASLVGGIHVTLGDD